jgi:predicted DsbA family dithiol-disulfide isomerase
MTTNTPSKTLVIDFVSDVACPWCAVGLAGLEKALAELDGEIDVELRFQPFELNPTMAPEGVDAAAYLKAKYGLSDEQLRVNQARIAERGAAAGFRFGQRTRIWGTFDAHRLLAWALDTQGAPAQRRLKRALLEAYHGEGRNPSDRAVLLDAATRAGLDAAGAQAVLDGDAYTREVREAEALWQRRGITAVPAAIVDDRYVIAGGQPAEQYVQALRQIAAAPPAAESTSDA